MYRYDLLIGWRDGVYRRMCCRMYHRTRIEAKSDRLED